MDEIFIGLIPSIAWREAVWFCIQVSPNYRRYLWVYPFPFCWHCKLSKLTYIRSPGGSFSELLTSGTLTVYLCEYLQQTFMGSEQVNIHLILCLISPYKLPCWETSEVTSALMPEGMVYRYQALWFIQDNFTSLYTCDKPAKCLAHWKQIPGDRHFLFFKQTSMFL